jgi:hypothetical protein
MNIKKISIVVSIITLSIVIGVTIFFVNGKIREKNADWYKCSKLVNASIPRDTKVLISSDSHGGLLGDGEYFVVFQFTGIQYKEFLASLYQNKTWTDLPLPKELEKIIFGERKGTYSYEGHGKKKIPYLKRNGKYYFFDRFVKDNPQYKGASILNRPSNNFIFGLLDNENRKLYIIKYDS